MLPRDRLLLALLGLTGASFQVSLGALMRPLMQCQPVLAEFAPVFEKVLLGDLLSVPLAFWCLLRFGWRQLPGVCLAGLLVYGGGVLFLGMVHDSRQDLPYWVGQLLHAAIYYVFLAGSLHFGVAVLARAVVRGWALVTPFLLFLGMFFDLGMTRHMGEYATMSSLLTERFQLLAGNPNKLVAFHLFIALCFLLGWENHRFSLKAWAAYGFFCLITVLTKSRDVPLVFLLGIMTVWNTTSGRTIKACLACGAVCLVAVSLVGTVAIYRNGFPLVDQFPYLNLRYPSSYWARSQYPYVRMLGEATPAQILLGRGYEGLAEPYHQLKSVEMIKAALAPYQAESAVAVHPWLYILSPPHNAWLQILNGGGLLWLISLAFLVFAPAALQLRIAREGWGYLACLLVESLSHDNIHYPWPFAGLGLLHAVLIADP